MSKMFEDITKKWNPVHGCNHHCYNDGCWAHLLATTRLKHCPSYKEGFKPTFVEKEMHKTFKKGDFVLVCGMGDLFGSWVPLPWIFEILNHIKRFPDATFLLLTKNPDRYRFFKIPENCICGATVETDIIQHLDETKPMSYAPPPHTRLYAMMDVQHPRKRLAIEPIMNFNLDHFVSLIQRIKPELVYVGYDNYKLHLPEPNLKKTLKLIEELEKFTIVKRKTIRKAWWEDYE